MVVKRKGYLFVASLSGHRVLHATDLGEHRCTSVHSRTNQCGIDYGALHVHVSHPEMAGVAFPKSGMFFGMREGVLTEYISAYLVRTYVCIQRIATF